MVFDQLRDFVLKNQKDGISLETLDGCFLNWIIFKDHEVSKSKTSTRDPFTEEKHSYHVNVLNFKKVNVRKMRLGFLPGFIHSMDASIMRKIITNVHKEGYIVNHLHDSIQFHPNYYNTIYRSIEEIYCGISLQNVVYSKFYLQNLKRLPPGKQAGLTELFEKFKENSTTITIVKSTLRVNNLYPFE